MNAFEVYFPTRLIFGPGKISVLGEKVSQLGDKVFLVMDPFLKGSKLAEAVKEDLKQKGLEYVEFYDIVPNPRSTTIDGAVEVIKKENCDVVAAIGGGSAIDSAKAMALVAVHGGSCWDYTERLNEDVKRPKRKGLPVVVVPTTAGTGTEGTPCSVINNPDLHLKCTIINPVIYPEISIVDPELMVSKPPKLTVLTAIDTFAHSFESYISIYANPWSEMLSLESIRLFAENIRKAYEDGTDIEARANLAFACTLGGIAIAHAGVTVPHALGQPLSALTDAPHGGTIAACISQVIEWTLPDAEEKFAKVAEIFDPSTACLSNAEKAGKLPAILRELFKDLGVDVTFGGYGLKEEEIEKFTDIVWTSFHQDLLCHPKKVERGDIITMVKNCMY